MVSRTVFDGIEDAHVYMTHPNFSFNLALTMKELMMIC